MVDEADVAVSKYNNAYELHLKRAFERNRVRMAVQIRDTYIRAVTLIGYSELLGSEALLESLLKEVGIDPIALKAIDTMISFRKFAELNELIASRLNRPSFGLEFTAAAPDHFPHTGPLVLLGSFVKALDEWMETSIKYWRFHTNGFVIKRITDEALGLAGGRYIGDPVTMPSRQVTESIMGNLCRLCRIVISRHDENPTVVRFQHAQPKDLSLHQEVFRCPVEFNADHTEILYDPKLHEFPTSGRLRPLKPLVGRYLRHRIERIDVYDASTTSVVSLTIPSIIGSGQCSAEVVADALGVHPKALQRRLAAEGTTFSEIIEFVRENMARRLLIESDASVERIAGLLDYSATPPFTLAFRRWTGQTPLAFRKTERSLSGLK